MLETYLTLALLWFLAAATPGPNFFAVMQTAAGRGRAAAFACAYGTVLGTLVWAFAGFFGLTALFAAFPAAATVIRVAGALYLIWVGITMFRGASRTEQPVGSAPVGRAFLFGLATNLANPKTAAFAASLFAVSLPAEASITQSFGAILMVTSISAGWYTVVAFLGSTEHLTRLYARARTWLLRLTGVLFASFGARLLSE